MTDELIKPALTLEEWRAVQAGGNLTGGYDLDYAIPDGDGLLRDRHTTLAPHGAAAALLYGYFTPADVQNLRGLAGEGPFADQHIDPSTIARSLAAKIAALLPPDPEALRQQLEDAALKQAQKAQEGG